MWRSWWAACVVCGGVVELILLRYLGVTGVCVCVCKRCVCVCVCVCVCGRGGGLWNFLCQLYDLSGI